MRAIKKKQEMHLGVALVKTKDEKARYALKAETFFCEKKWNHAKHASFE